MTIQELREKRAKAWDDAREFLDSKRNDSGLLSEEDSKTYDAMEQQIVAYGKEIDRLERQEKLAREMNAATSVPLVSVPGTHTEQSEKTGIASDSYNKAFWNNIRNRNYIDVHNDLQIGTDSEGGCLLQLRRFSNIGLYLETEEVTINAGNNIGYACRPVHSTVFFPAEASRHGSKVLHNCFHNIGFFHLFQKPPYFQHLEHMEHQKSHITVFFIEKMSVYKNMYYI